MNSSERIKKSFLEARDAVFGYDPGHPYQRKHYIGGLTALGNTVILKWCNESPKVLDSETLQEVIGRVSVANQDAEIAVKETLPFTVAFLDDSQVFRGVMSGMSEFGYFDIQIPSIDNQQQAFARNSTGPQRIG